MKRFKIISLAVAGVVAATAITASAVGFPKNEEVRLTEFEEQLLCGINPCGEASPEEREAIDENYKISLLLEHGVIASAHPADDVFGEDGLSERDREAENITAGQKPIPLSEQYKEELDAILAEKESTEIKLTQISSSPYLHWTGRFSVARLSSFSVCFEDPMYFDVSVADGKNVTVTPKSNYKNRYKKAVVYATYQKGGETKKTSATDDGYGTFVLKPDAPSGWTLVETAIFVYVYKGENITTPYDEIAVIHLVDSSYATSAQYAENSYASLIDQYIQIEN